MKTFESTILWQGQLHDGVVVFTLISPRIIRYEFKCFDAEFFGTFELVKDVPLEDLPQMLMKMVSERYLNDTIAIRKQLAITVH